MGAGRSERVQAAPVSGLLSAGDRTERVGTAGGIGSLLGPPPPQGTRMSLPTAAALISMAQVDQVVTSAAFTVEMWIRTTITDDQTLLVSHNILLSDPQVPRFFLAENRLGVQWGPETLTSADTTAVSDGQWHHVAVSFTANAATFLKDGVALDTIALSTQRAVQGGGLQLGRGEGSDGFVGDLHDVRVWTVGRAVDDIAADRFTTPTGTETGLGLATVADRLDNSVRNRVTGQVEDVLGGAVMVWGDLPAAPTCAYRLTGGTQDRVELTAAAAITTDAATLEFWVQIDPSTAEAPQTLLDLTDGDDVAPRITSDGGGRVGFYWGGSYSGTDTTPIADGQWHHLAVVFDRGTVTIVKDGVPTADSYQFAAPLQSGTSLLLGVDTSGAQALTGLMTQVRVWNTVRSLADIQGFRFVALTGAQPGLVALATLAGADPARPATLVPTNAVTGAVGALTGAASVVAAAAPAAPPAGDVWTVPTPGIAPSGPVVTGVGLAWAEHGVDSAGAPTTVVRSADPRTGAVQWTYDVQANTQLEQAVVPAALTVAGGVLFVGVQSAVGDGRPEIHLVDTSTGTRVAPGPLLVPQSTALLTRPVVSGGVVYIGTVGDPDPDGDPTALLVWTSIDGQTVGTYQLDLGGADLLTDPLVVGGTAFIGIDRTGGGAGVIAVDVTSAPQGSGRWDFRLADAPTGPLSVSAGLAFGTPASGTAAGGGWLVIPASDGWIAAVDATTGVATWQKQVSGEAVLCTPAVIGSTVCVGVSDGIVIALDLATGDELWRADTGSAITTDAFIVQDAVLYFANQGDGVSVAPAFLCLDTAGQGADLVTFDVPDADTILFAEGIQNGVAYFYGSQNVYAVNMQNVVHEFTVATTLIVEDYDIPDSGAPTGSDTSYRVTISLTDELGNRRIRQSVQVWSADPVYLVNLPGQLGRPVELGPQQPMWLRTDTSGSLTLAVSAFADGNPGSTPNVACPPLYLWATFMDPGEVVVVYPDHDHLTTLATVQGSSTAADAAPGTAPAVRYLDQATGYDGAPLIASTFSSPEALTAIASTIRNTVGAPAGTTGSGVAARLPGAASASNRYIADPTGMPNVVHFPDATAPTSRAWVPGVDATFTLDLSSGQPVYTPGTFDIARPATDLLGAPLGPAAVGGVLSDIGAFVDNVVDGGEHLLKVAWQATKDGVAAVLHAAENTYELTITTLEDAVSVVVGFLKQVVTDIRAVIQWLSTLFQWDNFVTNHRIIAAAVINRSYDPTQPESPTNEPGMLDRLQSWVSQEAARIGSGQSSLTDGVAAGFTGRTASTLTATGQGMQGQSVQSTRSAAAPAGNGYSYGGTDTSGQGRWLQQKVQENGGTAPPTSASVGRSLGGVAAVDPTVATQAIEAFLQTLNDVVATSFADFPTQLQTQLASLQVTITDPRTLLSTGLADLLAVFEVLAEDGLALVRALVPAIITLLDALVGQIGSWLTEPIDIPFVSALYRSVTGDDLSVLDLLALLAAFPATFMLDLITGSPTPPPETATPTAGLTATASAAEAKGILLGVAAFAAADLALIADIIALTTTPDPDNAQDPSGLINRIDFGLDVCAYGLGFATSFIGSDWTDADSAYWTLAALPLAWGYAGLFYDIPFPETFDAVMATGMLIMSSLYAGFFPSTYRDAPKAPGIVIAGNVLGAASSIIEIFVVLCPGEATDIYVYGSKGILGAVGNILGFTADVLGVVDS